MKKLWRILALGVPLLVVLALPGQVAAANNWAVGNTVGLCAGTDIRTGSGFGFPVHTVVPEDNWVVVVIDGPRFIDGAWWDIDRAAAGDPSGGTGWVYQSQADSCPAAGGGGGGGGDGGGDGDGDGEGEPSPPACGVLPSSGLDTCQLEKGDILLIDAVGVQNVFGFIGTYWFHTGIYDGEGNVLEASNPDEGVNSKPIELTGFADASDWVVLRLNPEHQSKIDGAVQWAQDKADAPSVGFMPVSEWLNPANKLQETQFYCSLFVWRAFNEQGLDLDFNLGLFEIIPSPLATALSTQVLPDDLYASALIPSGPTTVVQDSGGGGFWRTLFILLSPADLRVTDAGGNVTGIDPQTGGTVNSIPGAYYTGPTEEPELITVPDIGGASRVEVHGTGTGIYSLGIQVIGAQTANTDMFQWETHPGQVDIFEVSDPRAEPGQLQPILLTVQIDIKPGSDPNSINPDSRGTVPVAILSTTVFDATTVDPMTVTLAGASVQLRGRNKPMASFEDVNGDGLLDLVVHIIAEELQLDSTDTEATLEGYFNGIRIIGVDSVKIVPPQG